MAFHASVAERERAGQSVLNWVAGQLGLVSWLLPAYFLMFAVTAYPLAMNLINSFLGEAPIGQSPPFVGLANYQAILGAPEFLAALFHTLQWTVGSIILSFTIGLGLALLLNQGFPGEKIARVLFLLPWMTPSVATAIIWRFIYNTDYGVLNSALRDMGLGAIALGWITDPNVSLYAVILVNVWRGYGFYMIMLLGGLQAVPGEILDAAAVDGAGGLRRLWSVILPQIQPVIVMVVLLDLIWVTNDFATIYVVTGGGPLQASETLPLFVYYTAFKSTQFNQAAAGAIILFLIAATLIAVYLFALARLQKREELI